MPSVFHRLRHSAIFTILLCSLLREKNTVKVRWLKVKSHGPRIRAHRCGAFGRLMRAAPWLRRRFNLNQYAIEQGSSDWLIILVSLGILIISFQPGERDSLDCLQTVNKKCLRGLLFRLKSARFFNIYI